MLHFSREAARRLNDIVKFAPDFELLAFYTDTIRSREQLPGFVFPDKPPGQALGFRCSFATVSYALPNGESKRARAEITPPTFHSVRWMTVVQPRDAERALVALLKLAQYKLMQARLHAVARGDTA